MPINFLSVSTLENVGCGVVFFHGQVFLYPEGATLDTRIVLNVKHERLYKLQGQPVCESNGLLDSESTSTSDTGSFEASSSTFKRLSWYAMTYLDDQESEETHRSLPKREY
jgi:hypothetical protein